MGQQMNQVKCFVSSSMTRVHLLYKPVCVLLIIVLTISWTILYDNSRSAKDVRANTGHIEQYRNALENFGYLGDNMYDDMEILTSGRKSTSDAYMKMITLTDVNRRFCPRARDTCEDDCDCEDTLTDTKTVVEWENALKEDKVMGRALFRSNEYVFPWEEVYLSNPPLDDVKALPDLRLSKVWFLLHGRVPILQNVVRGKKYEKLAFRVDLFDGYGIKRPLGGDELRVWISEDPSTKSGRRFSATGSVEDLGDGSYIVTVTPVWTGLTNLNIGVVYPREYIRSALHHSRIGSNRFIFGLYKHKDLDVEEVTVCHATPNIPGRSCICNFTSINTVPFYCGRPLDKRLKCEDWTSVWPASQPPFKDLTPAEIDMASQMSRPANETVIKHDIVIQAVDNGEDPSLPPCTRTSRATTWNKESPRGFWTKGPAWTSLICYEPEMTPRWVQKCLRSTHIWLIGDSNIARIRTILCSLLDCTYEPHKTKWPDSLLGRNEDYNITVNFRPHEHPLYLRPEWMSLYLNGGISKYLSSVPSTGKHVVIIHYFLHLASSHLSALHYRLVALRDALLNLLKRNPQVIVGIRGPHISTVQWTSNHMFGGDVLGTFMIRMFHDILKDVKKRVVFLDGWDMSISIRNEQLHPSNSIPNAMLRTLLSFKCS